MDLLEWVYHKVAKRRLSSERIKEELVAATVAEEIFSLKAIVSFILKGEYLPIQTGKGIGRVASDKIVLPAEVKIFPQKENNRAVLLHKALVASIIYRDNLKYSRHGLSYAERSLEIVNFKDQILRELDLLFPQFLMIHQNLKARLVNLSLTGVEEKDFSKLELGKNTESYFRWQKFPECSLAFWVEPQQEARTLSAVGGAKLSEVLDRPSQEKTEMEGESSTEAPEEVSLKEKEREQSPVFHSFEKLETADEYNGGSRVNDAEDDLANHSDALKELNMKHVTREEGGAGSIYKAHFSELFGLHLGRTPPPRFSKFKQMPEWNYKSQSFQIDHCRLYLLDSITSSGHTTSDFREDLEKKYASEIQQWRHKLSSLVSHRTWKDRQLDGEEWSIDAYSKYIADVKACGVGDNKIFTQRAQAHRSFQVCILMDLSLSSDSWVQNKRILDIQLESVGLCGLMLEGLSDTISVMGTWSETRHHCYLAPVKDPDSDWNTYFRNASHISPIGYTRLGPAIRYASSVLAEATAKKKLLILITDGKPTDLDHYEGKYGIEDMRHSLQEAQQLGIFVQALAVDQSAKTHFPQLFNKDKYRILSDPRKLPEQLFKIYYEFARTR